MLETEVIDDILIIKVPVRLGVGFNKDDFDNFQKQIIEASPNLILDFSLTKAIDSSAIGLILKKYVEFKKNDNADKYCICNVKRVISRTLEIIKLDEYIKFYNTIEDAVDFLKSLGE